MKKCPVCESNYWDNCICTVCGYDGSKDYENYKTLTKIPRVIAAQYKGNKAASAALKEISFCKLMSMKKLSSQMPCRQQ